jgi:hypothetical protein
MVRYDIKTLEPYQAFVIVDHEGDFDTHYTKITDPLIRSYLDMQKQLSHPKPMSKLFRSNKTLRGVYASLPFAPNMTREEYIPTRLFSLLRTLRHHFPRHRLLLSDFSYLPDTICGVNAPVVQTRHDGRTIACSTLLVKPGFFDIFFPTNFEQLRDAYEFVLSQPLPLSIGSGGASRSSPLSPISSSLSLGADFFSRHQPLNRRIALDGVTSASGLPVGERKSSVFTHAEFLETYADLSKTRLRSGENVMTDFYRHVKFLF